MCYSYNHKLKSLLDYCNIKDLRQETKRKSCLFKSGSVCALVSPSAHASQYPKLSPLKSPGLVHLSGAKALLPWSPDAGQKHADATATNTSKSEVHRGRD